MANCQKLKAFDEIADPAKQISEIILKAYGPAAVTVITPTKIMIYENSIGCRADFTERVDTPSGCVPRSTSYATGHIETPQTPQSVRPDV